MQKHSSEVSTSPRLPLFRLRQPPYIKYTLLVCRHVLRSLFATGNQIGTAVALVRLVGVMLRGQHIFRSMYASVQTNVAVIDRLADRVKTDAETWAANLMKLTH